MNSRLRCLLALALISIAATKAFAYGDNFSCPIGARGACLSFGEIVCRSGAQCVEQNSTCFRAKTCGFSNDFVCKSDFDNLASSCRNMQNDYNDIAGKLRRLQYKCSDQQSDYQSLVDEVERLMQERSELLLCISSRSEAASCVHFLGCSVCG